MVYVRFSTLLFVSESILILMRFGLCRENVFHVPADMPACTDGVCHCAWFWIHSPNSGGEQMFMNAFKCKITNTKPTAKKIGKPQLARRCGYDPVLNRHGDPKNCTVGAKQPLYWLQKERNNVRRFLMG